MRRLEAGSTRTDLVQCTDLDYAHFLRGEARPDSECMIKLLWVSVRDSSTLQTCCFGAWTAPHVQAHGNRARAAQHLHGHVDALARELLRWQHSGPRICQARPRAQPRPRARRPRPFAGARPRRKPYPVHDAGWHQLGDVKIGGFNLIVPIELRQLRRLLLRCDLDWEALCKTNGVSTDEIKRTKLHIHIGILADDVDLMQHNGNLTFEQALARCRTHNLSTRTQHHPARRSRAQIPRNCGYSS